MSIMQTFKHWHQEGTQGPISPPEMDHILLVGCVSFSIYLLSECFHSKKKESRGREVGVSDWMHASSPSPVLAFMMALVVQWLRLSAPSAGAQVQSICISICF